MTLGKSWRTNLSAIVVGALSVLMGIPTLTSAITAWSQHQPVDWRSVLVTSAIGAAAVGLAAAKDAKVHSTQDQVAISTAETAVAQVKKADEAAKP